VKKKIELSKIYPLFFTLVFVIILLQYSFSTFDAIFYDLWVKSDFMSKKNDQIVLITMDEVSDQFLGEVYPYTYASHFRLLKKLMDDKPYIINYFVNLQEPESNIDQNYYEEFQKKIESFTEEDRVVRFSSSMDDWGGERLPPDDLKKFGYSLNILNVDSDKFSKDGVCRRAILNVSGEDSIHLWTAKKFALLTNRDPIDAKDLIGSYYNKEADASFSLFRYPYNTIDEKIDIIKIPFYRVLNGTFPKGLFKNKIVLIGSQYISNTDDFLLTPFDKEEKVPKLNVHASIIESLSQGKTVYEIPGIVTDILSLLFCVFLSFVISKTHPTKGLFITFSIVIGTVFVSYNLFVFLGLWIKVSHMIMSVFVVYYIWVPFRAIVEYQTRYKIEEEAKMLLKVDNLKRNFISLMSHDLKTPVAKIAGMADILNLKFDNNSDQRKLIVDIIDSTKELNKFITSILDLIKLESDEVNINLQSKDVNKIIEAVTNELRFEAEKNQIEIVHDLGPLYPVQIDPLLMKRVLSNLIENGIKYSGENSQINIRTWDDEKWVYIEIKDNGKGIPEEDLAHIFDKFYRVRNDSVHKVKGTGLGLYLVKYFIELQSGKINVDSGVNKGTTFVIQLKNL
jgi:signal transduction histidine kinase